eukprot:gene25396-31011_t
MGVRLIIIDEKSMLSLMMSYNIHSRLNQIFGVTIESGARYLSKHLVHPDMGAPAVTAEELNKQQDTSSWAYDKTTGLHYSNYFKPESSTWGGELGVGGAGEGSMQGGELGVEGAGEGSMQGGELGSVTLGLMADVGQTRVSEANLLATLAMRPDAVLLVGDLSYA